MKYIFTTGQSKAAVHLDSTVARVHGHLHKQQIASARFPVVDSSTDILIHQYSFI